MKGKKIDNPKKILITVSQVQYNFIKQYKLNVAEIMRQHIDKLMEAGVKSENN